MILPNKCHSFNESRQLMERCNEKIIGVIGQGSDCSSELLKKAEEVGWHIAQRGAVLICGGLGGVMEAASRGAKKGGGTTIGVLPGTDKNAANAYIDIPIVTGLGEARNTIIVRTADALIAVGGRFGTLSEIAFSLAFEKPIVGLDTWKNLENMIYCGTPEKAVKRVLQLL